MGSDSPDGPRPDWRPPPEAADGYLAFLAARDQLAAMSRPRFGWLLRLLGAGSGRGPASAGPTAVVRQRESHALKPYVVACDELAERLSTDERRRLRATGELPVWFLTQVAARAGGLRADARDW